MFHNITALPNHPPPYSHRRTQSHHHQPSHSILLKPHIALTDTNITPFSLNLQSQSTFLRPLTNKLKKMSKDLRSYASRENKHNIKDKEKYNNLICNNLKGQNSKGSSGDRKKSKSKCALNQKNDIAKIYLNKMKNNLLFKQSPQKATTSRIHKQNRNKSSKQQKQKTKKKPNKAQLWSDVVQQYGQLLTAQQVSQLKQCKWVYYLGHIKDRKYKHLFSSPKCAPSSARQTMAQRNPDKHDPLTDRKQPSQAGVQGQFYEYSIGDHIGYRWEIVQSIDRGSFGEVVKVFDHRSNCLQAMKIVRRNPDLVKQTYVQIKILAHIQQKDRQGTSGIVKLKNFTIFRHHICILFQLLDGNLYELITSNQSSTLNDATLRLFAVQLLNSLSFLKQNRIVHCDLKPENVVMQQWGKAGIKLVDFGTSCFEGEQIYEYLQSRFYRSPEIILGQPYSFPIDMWSLACLLVELKIGQPLFWAGQDIQQLLYFCKAIGYPKQADGQCSRQFLKTEEFQILLTRDFMQEYEKIKHCQELIENHPLFQKCHHLPSLQKLQERISVKNHNDQLFLDFISSILLWEPQKRLTPQKALQHPWLTQGLSPSIKNLYQAINKLQKQQRVHFKPKSNSKELQSKQIPSKERYLRRKNYKSKQNKSKSQQRQQKSKKQYRHQKSKSKSRSKSKQLQASTKKRKSTKINKILHPRAGLCPPGEFMKGFSMNLPGRGAPALT